MLEAPYEKPLAIVPPAPLVPNPTQRSPIPPRLTRHLVCAQKPRCAWPRLWAPEPYRAKRTRPATVACSDKITETESHGANMSLDKKQLETAGTYQAEAPLRSILEDIDEIGNFLVEIQNQRRKLRRYGGIAMISGVLLAIAASILHINALTGLTFLALA